MDINRTICKEIQDRDNIIEFIGLLFEPDAIERYYLIENRYWVIEDKDGEQFKCSLKSMKKVFRDLIRTSENDKQLKIDELTLQINRMNKKIENLQKPIQESRVFSSVNEKLKNISEKLNSQNHKNSDQQDLSKSLIDILDAIQSLNEKISFIDSDLKRHKDMLRDIRNQGDTDSDNTEKTIKSINNILGTISLLRDDIKNIQVSPLEVEEKEEIKITNPDVALLKEMHETSQKLNDMILQTTLMLVSKNDEKDSEKITKKVEESLEENKKDE